MKSNWELAHAGVFTRDLENTVRYFQSLGLAPEVVPPRSGSWEGHKAVNIEFGQEIHFGGDTRRPFLQLIYIGDLEVEILRAPIERPKGEALAYGEGCNHVCFNVPDIDGETDLLVKKGLRIIQDFHLDDVRLEDYLDTRRHGNMLLSLRPLQTEAVKAQKAGYGIVNWKYQGVGAVVRSIEKTVKYYRSMDIADFRPQGMLDTSSIRDVKLHGKSPNDLIRAKTRVMRIGPVAYELIEPVEGEAVYKESLDRRGEGVINLTFSVEDLDRETSRLAEKGVSVVFSGKPEAGNAFAYFDTRRDGGDVMIKLVQR